MEAILTRKYLRLHCSSCCTFSWWGQWGSSEHITCWIFNITQQCYIFSYLWPYYVYINIVLKRHNRFLQNITFKTHNKILYFKFLNKYNYIIFILLPHDIQRHTISISSIGQGAHLCTPSFFNVCTCLGKSLWHSPK